MSYGLKAFSGGGFRIDLNNESYYFESSFSFPNAGYNMLLWQGEVDRGGEAEWIVKVKESVDRIEIECSGRHYRLSRALMKGGHRVMVKDTFTNLGDEDLGIMISNDVASKGPVCGARVSGCPAPTETRKEEWTAENPTLFLAQRDTGVGVVAEDDVYRVQLGIWRKADGGSLYTGHFGLGPKSSYTMEWSVYPVSPPNYWDFINAVRRDWDVNFTIDGPLEFTSAKFLSEAPVEELKKLDSQRGWRLMPISPWLDYWDGYGMTMGEFANVVKPAIAKVKEANPNIVTFICIEPPLREVGPGELPEYIDSVPILSSGALSLDKPYQHEIPANLTLKGYAMYDVYPEIGNKRFREIMGYIDFAMDVCGYVGVYFDSFMGDCYGVHSTYDKWDGHTADIDPKSFTVVKKYVNLKLITGEALKRFVEHVQSKGGVVVANSQPSIRCMQNLRIYRFVECNTLEDVGYMQEWLTKAHLYSPIGLGYRLKPEELTPENFMKDVRNHLEHGTLYYYYGAILPEGQRNYGVVKHMYPFTPREIHGGWLIGEERIISMRSGIYGWGDKSDMKCHLFDVDGREIPNQFTIRKIEEKTVVDVILEEGQIVILDRIMKI